MKWVGLKAKLEENGGLLALKLVESMNRPEKEILNPTMLAAILIDVIHMDQLTER